MFIYLITVDNGNQRVCIKGVKSSWLRVLGGVLQRSVLGPILFLIYINDLDEGILSWILKFADDTNVLHGITRRRGQWHPAGGYRQAL